MSLVYWRDQTIHMMRLVGDFYKNSEFTDCALDTEGGLIYGHKTILAAWSPYFQKLFRDNHGMKIFPLKEVHYKDMKLILDFIYCGEIDFPATDMGSLRQLAELLQISSLQCASQNFLDTFSANAADEGGGGNSKTCFHENFMEPTERENYLYVRENRCMGSQELHEDSEFGFSASCQNIDQQSESVHRTITRSNSKTLSKPVMEDQSEICFMNTNVIKMDTDEGNIEDELPPLTFVGVSSVLVKSEDLGDEECETCVNDLLLKNPLEVHPDDCNTCKVKEVKEEKDETEMGFKEEIEVSELDTNITETDSIVNKIKKESYSDVAPLGNEMYHSWDELTTNIEGNMFYATEQIGDINSNQNKMSVRAMSSLCSEDCKLEKSQELEVKFESICNPDIEEKKTFLEELDVENTNDDEETSSLKQGYHDSYSDLVQAVNHGFGVNTSSKPKLKEAVVVLRRIYPPYQVIAGVDKSDFKKTYRASTLREDSSEEERKLQKGAGKKESFNHSLCNAVLISKDKWEHVPLHSADKVHIGSGNTQVKHTAGFIRENSFSCQMCDAIFKYQCQLKTHMRNHTGEKPFKCEVCNVSFGRKGSLKMHMRIHTGEKPFKCEVCEVSFGHKDSMKKHMRIHTGEKPFKCGVCDHSFREKGHLNIHMRIHTGEKPFKCVVCAASFTSRGELKPHMRIHTGEKPFKCGVCDFSFTGSGNLNKHMRIHTGEKPFKCGVCDASFTGRGDLNRHKRIHTGEKPFKCGVCDFSFTESGNLNKHMRIHTGEKPFKCGVCDVTFRQKENLKRHMKIHTGEKPF